MNKTPALLARTILLFALAAGHAAAVSAQEQQPTPQQRGEMLRQWMAASHAQLQDYQWYAQTVITVDSEKKSDVKDRCYYGQDGKLQKVDMGDSVKHDSALPGLLLPGKLINMVAKHKEEEMKDYINSAITLLHDYVPPSSTDIQAAIHAGLMSVNVLDPGHKVELLFHDFKKSGDQLGVQIELPTNRLLGLSVKTYVDKPDDLINVDVTMGVMANGTIYTESVVLNDAEKNLEISVTNSDYERIKQ